MLGSAVETFLSAQAIEAAPAIVLAIVEDGHITQSYVRGALDDGSIPNLDTVFRIASMTKSFTAAAILRLRDAGLLSLDMAIVDVLGWAAAIVGPTSDSPAVTVRHLLTMSAGLASDDPWGDRMLDLSDDVFRSMVKGGASFAYPPGYKWQYSNYGYALLGSVIKAVTGVSAQTYISDELLTPLSMHSTTWTTPIAGNIAAGTHTRDGLDVGPALGDGAFAPMGGLWSTATDIATWVAFLSDAYPARDGDDSPMLSRASRREMQCVHTSWEPKIVATPYGHRMTELGYGMGIMVMQHPDLGTVVHHSGGLPGYGSNMRWIPDRGFGVVALGNRTYAPMRLLTAELVEVLNLQQLIPPASKKWPTGTAVFEEAAKRLVDWLWQSPEPNTPEPQWAMNVDLDLPLELRRREADELVANVGERLGHVAEADTAMSGRIKISTSSHDIEIAMMLSPEVPPKIQRFDVVAFERQVRVGSDVDEASPQPKQRCIDCP